MLHNIHGEKITAPVTVTGTGDQIVIPAITDGEIFIHELLGDTTAQMVLSVKAGARTLAAPEVAVGQGLTYSDIPGMDGEPRFKCFQNEAFILNLGAAGTFNGSIVYSYKK